MNFLAPSYNSQTPLPPGPALSVGQRRVVKKKTSTRFCQFPPLPVLGSEPYDGRRPCYPAGSERVRRIPFAAAYDVPVSADIHTPWGRFDYTTETSVHNIL